jgi:hypothetical protein
VLAVIGGEALSLMEGQLIDLFSIKQSCFLKRCNGHHASEFERNADSSDQKCD